MVTEQPLSNIFLSASIPDPKRHFRFSETADVVAIRDAVRALATCVIPNCNLVWGGHPSITPLISYVLNKMSSVEYEHITLYQSEYFNGQFPKENNLISKIVYTPSYGTLEESVDAMREAMLDDFRYDAAIFIGGMEGILDEFDQFRRKHPSALAIPVASTGGGAKILFEQFGYDNPRLKNDYAYMALFRELLRDFIN